MAGAFEREVELADFGDERLNQRLGLILGARHARPGASIPGACQTKGEVDACYRFLSNDAVSPEGILAPHIRAVERRARACDAVVVCQDTSVLDFTRPQECVGGPLDEGRHRGFLMHALLACTPSGLPLGLLGLSTWHRPEKSGSKKMRHRDLPIDQKESHRWIQGLEIASAFKQRLPEATRVVVVADSESDIYDCLVTHPGTADAANFVIRACQDRSLPNESAKLFEAVASTPALGTYSLDVRARPAASHDGRKRKAARAARRARITIRAARVRLSKPRRKANLPYAELNAVLMREDHAPDGEHPIEWLLLTDLPIDTPEQIQDVIAYYVCRWSIEVYFRVLKGGCRVENLQLETNEALKNCIALYSIVAWRLLYLTRIQDTHPDTRCDVLFDKDEWQAAYAMIKRKAPPNEPPSLKEMMRMIASIGGFHSLAKEARPGVQAMWTGLTRLKDIAYGWSLAHQGS